MHKLAVFDLDGTLLDTCEDIADAGNYALSQLGFQTHRLESYKQFVGSGTGVLFEHSLPPEARDGETKAKMKDLYFDFYTRHYMDKTRPYSGVKVALHELKECGVRLAVLSNKPHRFTVPMVREFFPGLFELVYGQREGVPHKPDPTALLQILEETGVEKDSTVYIGDSSVDVDTGKNAGVPTIGVLWGFRTRKELEKHGADVIVDKSSQFREFIVDNPVTIQYTANK